MARDYVLITAARNEENYIERTIQSIVAQTVLPRKWVIVSDRSTDRTDEIIRTYSANHRFIDYLRIENEAQWSFSSKAHAIRSGLAKILNIDYTYIGNLDADITFDADYYEKVLHGIEENPKLGIVGGMIAELNGDEFKMLNYNLNSVAGAVQLFRRDCFEGIGGYIPLKTGGIDAVAEIMARMNGWLVKSFPALIAYHHRTIGITKEDVMKSRFRYGVRDYSIGTHPLFMILKCLNPFREKPFILGGLQMLRGYLWAWSNCLERPVPENVVRFLQKEQKTRMLSAICFRGKRL